MTPGLRDGVEEGIEVEGDVRQQKSRPEHKKIIFQFFFFKLRPGVRVGGDTLKKCQGVTNSVALVGSEHLQLAGLVQLETVIQMLVGK